MYVLLISQVAINTDDPKTADAAIAVRTSLTELKLSHLDLCLIHWPSAMKVCPINGFIHLVASNQLSETSNQKNIEALKIQ